jgi:hypothetical protein
LLGAVPKTIVCDNLKVGVTTASQYEPVVNRTYLDLDACRSAADRDGGAMSLRRWPHLSCL